MHLFKIYFNCVIIWPQWLLGWKNISKFIWNRPPQSKYINLKRYIINCQKVDKYLDIISLFAISLGPSIWRVESTDWNELNACLQYWHELSILNLLDLFVMMKMNHVLETTKSCLQFHYVRLCVVIQSSHLSTKLTECFFCGRNSGWLPLETVLGLSFTPSDPLPVRDRSLPQSQGPVKFQTQSRAFFIAKETLPTSPRSRRHHKIWQHERVLWKLTLKEQRYNKTNPQSRLRLINHMASVGNQRKGRPEWVVTGEERLC